MLKIRLQRTGRTNVPTYRIVVTEHTRGPKSSSFVEQIGTYNPNRKQDTTLNKDRASYWMSVGAQPSITMHNMLVGAGVLSSKKINALPKKTVPQKQPEAVK